MIVKLLTEHHLEFLILKEGGTGWSESTLVKMSTLLEITCRGSYYCIPVSVVYLSERKLTF